MYPYVSFLIFQQLSEEEVLSAIETLNGEPYEEYLELDENEQIDHLHEELICALCRIVENDSAEAGYPEKLDAELNTNNWKVSNISRFGIFDDDPRFDDELLISEARGLAGNNINRYSGIAESTQPERVKELIWNSQYSLENASPWLFFTKTRLEQILIKKEKVRIGLNIYNPRSTIETLAYAFIRNDSGYFPSYQLIISDIDKSITEFYIGELIWDGDKSQYSLLGEEIDTFMMLLEIQSGEDSEEKLALANLHFVIKKIVIENNKITSELFITVEEDCDTIIEQHQEYQSLFEWAKGSPVFLSELLSIYRLHTNI